MHSPLRRLGSVAAVALLALLAGCSGPSASLVPPDEWSRNVPAKYGMPVDSRIVGETVLVTTATGLIGMDRDTGAEKWWRDFTPDFTDIGGEGGLTRGIALFTLTVAGDAVVVTKAADKATGRHPKEVLDLDTGQTRFTVQAKVTIENGWFFTHVTKSAIITFDCVDLVECDISSTSLADGSPLWTINLPGGRVDLPDQLSWNQERGYDSDGIGTPMWRVAEEPEFALVNDHKTDTATTVDLDTGQIIGEWKRAENYAWYVLVGPTVVEVGADDMRGLDPATGSELWKHRLIGEDQGALLGYKGLLVVDGQLIDETESGKGSKRYQFVDLKAGPQGTVQAAPSERPLVVTPPLVVTVDALLTQAVATDPATGQQTWTTALPNTDEDIRLNESMYADDTLIISGTVDFDSPGAVWAVDTLTGQVATWAGESTLGYGGGFLVTFSSDKDGGYALHSHWV